MSRRVAVFCVFVCCLLTACRPTKPIEPLSVDFSCDFRAEYQTLTVQGTLTRHTAGTLQLTFTEPETLRDVSADWNGEDITLHYKGLSFSADALPERALGEQLIRAFDAALSGEGKREQNNDTVILNGTAAGNTFTYIYHASNGEPLSLSVPSLPLTVTFSNVH